MKQYGMICLALIMAVILTVTAFATESAADSSSINDVVISVNLLNQNPDPAKSGEIVELRFMVENAGGREASNVFVELDPSYPFLKIPGESYIQNISALQSYQQGSDAAIVKFRVIVDRDAVSGTGQISVKKGIFDPVSGSESSVTQNFDVDITSSQFAQIILIDKSSISPGNETSLKFTINNIGSSPIRNIVFSWNEPTGVILPVYSDDTKYVKYLDVGSSAVLEYSVVADVNANPGLYMLNLNMKFDAVNGSSGQSQINTKAGIFVGGETDFDVALSESSSGQTSLSVANIGNNPAYSVTVRIPQQRGVTVTGSSSSIIGNLDKGDYTIVSFQISSASVAGNQTAQIPGNVPPGNFSGQRRFNQTGMDQGNATGLQVAIDYTDTTGERHTIEKNVALQSSRSSLQTMTTRQQADYTIYIAIAAALAAVCAAFFYRRRKKLKKHRGA